MVACLQEDFNVFVVFVFFCRNVALVSDLQFIGSFLVSFPNIETGQSKLEGSLFFLLWQMIKSTDFKNTKTQN